jgi:hypothetical protein
MSLMKKPASTDKSLERSRRNGRKSQGAVTPEGKARAARANLRHGYYARESTEVMVALGENPRDYRRMMESLENNLSEGLESQLVGALGRALWRLQRSERMQDGLALKRVHAGMQKENLMNSLRLMPKYNDYDRLIELSREITDPDFFPSAARIHAFIGGFGDSPSAGIQGLIPLLEALRKARPGEDGEAPNSTPTQAQSAREKLQDALDEVIVTQDRCIRLLTKESEQIESAGNMAALMAPMDEKSVLMQRMEDSSLRQLWRLTHILMKIRGGALQQESETQEDIKNEGCS